MSTSLLIGTFVVFAIVLAVTLGWMVPPSRKDQQKRDMNEDPNGRDPSYVP